MKLNCFGFLVVYRGGGWLELFIDYYIFFRSWLKNNYILLSYFCLFLIFINCIDFWIMIVDNNRLYLFIFILKEFKNYLYVKWIFSFFFDIYFSGSCCWLFFLVIDVVEFNCIRIDYFIGFVWYDLVLVCYYV